MFAKSVAKKISGYKIGKSVKGHAKKSYPKLISINLSKIIQKINPIYPKFIKTNL